MLIVFSMKAIVREYVIQTSIRIQIIALNSYGGKENPLDSTLTWVHLSIDRLISQILKLSIPFRSKCQQMRFKMTQFSRIRFNGRTM